MARRILILSAVVLLTVASAQGAVLDATTSLNGLANPIPLAGGTQNVAANFVSMYNFNDKNGDGTGGDAVTPPGLSLGGNMLLTTDSTSINLSLNGGDLTGNSGVVSFDTHRNASSPAGNLAITNVGTISMGGIETWNNGTGDAGDVAIATSVLRAGDIRIDYILASKPAGSNNDKDGGTILIFSSGNVQIQTSGAVAGDIDVHVANGDGGTVTINHDGAFTARDILTWTPSTWTSQDAGNVTLEGDGLNNGASGELNLRTIDTRVIGASWGDVSGSVHISGYTGVHVTGNLLTENQVSSGGGTHVPGNITIEDIAGNVTIDGVINANAADVTDSDGDLSITATGTITLASLDLLLVNTVFLDAGGNTTVTGALENFSTASPGDGILDAPTGQFIYYDPNVGANAYLGGLTYSLAGGGELTPVPEPASLLLLAGAAIPFALRRRRSPC